MNHREIPLICQLIMYEWSEERHGFDYQVAQEAEISTSRFKGIVYDGDLPTSDELLALMQVFNVKPAKRNLFQRILRDSRPGVLYPRQTFDLTRGGQP